MQRISWGVCRKQLRIECAHEKGPEVENLEGGGGDGEVLEKRKNQVFIKFRVYTCVSLPDLVSFSWLFTISHIACYLLRYSG